MTEQEALEYLDNLFYHETVDDTELTAWERGFLEDVRGQVDKGWALTDRQMEVIGQCKEKTGS